MTAVARDVEQLSLGRCERILIALEAMAGELAAHPQREPNQHVSVAITAASTQVRAIRARLTADVALINRDHPHGATLEQHPHPAGRRRPARRPRQPQA
jgi:hypothetical protein